jgi:cyclopropane-fatty-acyl-phospholipid synthase
MMDAEQEYGLTERNIDQALVLAIMKSAGNPRISVRLWNGHEFPVTDEHPVACLEFLSRRAVLKLLYSPSVGFGECYSQGLIEVHGNFLAFINEVTAAITRRESSQYYLPRLRSTLLALRRNSPGRSKHNAHHHYDLGNDFYRMWLDEHLVYTCAYYDTPGATLAEAQVAKLDHVCRKLDLKPGQTVIDAGSGWGALAMHMAEHYGVEVKAYNISRAQVDWARKQAAAKGLETRIEFNLGDYRSIEERCDRFVSVGMLEHVGRANYRVLGELIKRCLKPEGLALIHTIGRSEPKPMDAWIRKYIFPGGHVPSLSEMMAVFEPNRFAVLDIENLRLHYARTCADWLTNFEAVAEKVSEMYSEEFTRMWRLYLAGSSAGFQSGTLQLYQVVFAHGSNNKAPWTREYQYPGSSGRD